MKDVNPLENQKYACPGCVQKVKLVIIHTYYDDFLGRVSLGSAIPVVTLATSRALASRFFLVYNTEYPMAAVMRRPPMVIVVMETGSLLLWCNTPPGWWPGGLFDPSKPAALTSSGLILWSQLCQHFLENNTLQLAVASNRVMPSVHP
ncbi:Putative uncharacterized ycf15 [Gossypium arboreum]|uniref:Uncharacterized ycf15 n=1 Tax=Gossypium arboreum TaxID=29729 RepID=A0A0B0NYC5_GOSAR|nr:Putative uncharacterized ycf15 [Gossypium arboreum]